MTISKMNKGQKLFNFQMPEGAEFKSLKDLYEQFGAEYIHVLTGCYISTKGNFGEQPVLLTPNYFVNAPKHLLDTVKDIMSDEDIIKQINGTNAGFVIETYKDKTHNRTCYSVRFVDLYDDLFDN